MALSIEAVIGCDVAGKHQASEAGAPRLTRSAATNVTAIMNTSSSSDRKPEPSSAAARLKALDATLCNPGTSLEPVDRGKTIQSDHFKYTLLDVRTDVVDNAFAPVKKVFLVKLQVENVTSKMNLAPSVADVDLTREKAGAERIRESNLHYKTDFFYPRSRMCVDLGADVKPGSLPPGTKAIGYYAYQAPEKRAFTSLWFDARNVSSEAVHKGNLLRVAGTLRIK